MKPVIRYQSQLLFRKSYKPSPCHPNPSGEIELLVSPGALWSETANQNRLVSACRARSLLNELKIQRRRNPVRRAGFPACWFTGLSSPVFPKGDWKVARTRRQE